MPHVTSVRNAKSPLAFASWLAYEFQSSVLDDIWFQILFFTAWAAMVTCVTRLTGANISVNNSLFGTLGGLLSFVVSLRTSSAYERFAEGRKCFSSIQLGTRNFATMVWAHVNDEPAPKPADGSEISEADRDHYALRAMLEKRTIIRVLEAFGPAIKHHLRSEQGPFYQDLYPLVSFLPRYAFPVATGDATGGPEPTVPMAAPMWGTHSSGSTLVPCYTEADVTQASTPEKPARPFHPRRQTSTIELLPAYMPPRTTLYDQFPFLYVFRPIVRYIFRAGTDLVNDEARAARLRRKHNRAATTQGNIPLEITLFLSSYVSSVVSRGLIVGPQVGNLMSPLAMLQDSLAQLERIVSTPLPHAYILHLRLVAWVFLVTTPFQLVSLMGWITIPGVAITAAFFLGFLELGTQLEQPFGYDSTDLPLDDFCAVMQRELAEIVAHPRFEPEPFLLARGNTPFAPVDMRSAAEILRQGRETGEGLMSARRTQYQHFQHVNHEFARRRNAAARGHADRNVGHG